MFIHNYHSHSIYCKHSIFSPEELILKAIENGFKTFGITEHINLPDGYELNRISNEAELALYINEVNCLKKKYRDKIEVFCALESEIVHPITGDNLISWIDKHWEMDGIDYIIAGLHTYDTGKYCVCAIPERGELERYVTNFKEAVDNKNILYIAHPDVFLKGCQKWTKELLAASREMIQYAKDNDKVLGLNFNGFLQDLDFCYPNQIYFNMVGEIGAKVIFELDAHEGKVFDKKLEKRALKIARIAGLNIVDKII